MTKVKVLFAGVLVISGLVLLAYRFPQSSNQLSPMAEPSKAPLSWIELPANNIPLYKYQLIDMEERHPVFTLATEDGNKPHDDGDRAQATVVDSLQLIKACQQDPSLIVVDVGAMLGDFGLYAAACGCEVFMFEVQPTYTDLIRASIEANNFSMARVHVIQKAVSDLPSNSNLTFSVDGGETTIGDGPLQATTIRLDDIDWPEGSSILMLKVDVEGYELNVLRSAARLFRAQRIQHLIFEYTAWWTNRGAQEKVIPYVEKKLAAKYLFALDRYGDTVYGPMNRQALKYFHKYHAKVRLQTDIYARFVDWNSTSSLKVKPYYLGVLFA